MPFSPTASAAPTHTTISAVDVISGSTQNLSTCLSRCRPWPEFATISALDFPSSLSEAVLRFRRNAAYFSINYSILLTVCAALSLIGKPIALITLGFVFFLWLTFYFFREDPLWICGHEVSDWAVTLGLLVVSAAALWSTGPLNSLSIGIVVGLIISLVHGMLRNPEGLFLDENDAVSNGLIVSYPTAADTRSGRMSSHPPV